MKYINDKVIYYADYVSKQKIQQNSHSKIEIDKFNFCFKTVLSDKKN
jgi:HD superfamily phosphohydrolase YqeK